MSNIAWGRFAAWSTIIIGSGYAIMKFTTPNEQQLYDALSPELKKKADQIRAARIQNELQQKLEQASNPGNAAASQGPIWAERKEKTWKSS